MLSFSKVLTGSLAALALIAGSVFAADKEAGGDCCKSKLACCTKPSACCKAEKKAGCCEKGQKCCAENLACCGATPPACCVKGAACCDSAKACCGEVQKNEVKKTDAHVAGCCGAKPSTKATCCTGSTCSTPSAK
ncbi:MAG: hypothetical protein K8T25_23700 [Planctomycetia bacterium]|nr:hypothetical protein [Planctomycetia bacterium]